MLLDLISGLLFVIVVAFVVVLAGRFGLALLNSATVPKALKEAGETRQRITAAAIGLGVSFAVGVPPFLDAVFGFVAANPFGVLATGPILGGLAIEGTLPISGGEFLGVGLLVVATVLLAREVYVGR
jgi:hypothetical protein